MKYFLQVIGSILIITGTAVGAGMLAIPIVTAALGFGFATILLVICWLVMTYTALLILEANLAFPPQTNMSTMAVKTLGRPGQIVTWAAYLLLLYALTAAYITGGSSLLSAAVKLISHHDLADWISVLIFTIILGSFVVWGTAAVDRLNRLLISIKALAFIFLLILVYPHLRGHLLLQTPLSAKLAWFALPILVTSFGSHIVIPSIRTYLGDNPKLLRRVVLIGSTLPLIIYLLWELAILGIVPVHGHASFAEIHAGDIGHLLIILKERIRETAVTVGANIFTDVAVTTSFLGVCLSLFDFNADGFNLDKKRLSHKALITLITFLPPLLFAWLYPHGFILALGYASIFVAILLNILPPLMVYQTRRLWPESVRVAGHSFWLWMPIVFGIIIIVVELIK